MKRRPVDGTPSTLIVHSKEGSRLKGVLPRGNPGQRSP